jgi:hypothetical protein
MGNLADQPVILGHNLYVEIVTAAGSISLNEFTQVDVDESLIKEASNVGQSQHEEEVVKRKKLTLTFKGLRRPASAEAYSDLPKTWRRVTDINFTYKDESAAALTGTEDLPDFVYNATTNADGYKLLAVTSKKASQTDGEGTYELVIESGIKNVLA